MNMELNARLIYLPTDFDQISQLYDTLSINIYSALTWIKILITENV